VFIPFLGAFIAMKDRPADALVEARVAYAGPVAGTAASLGCAAIGLTQESQFFLTLSYVGFFLNLFNMTPLGFLDGARVARVFSRGAWIVGIVVFGALFYASPSPQLGIIGVLSVMQALKRPAPDLDAVAPGERRAWAARYFGLCTFLAAGMWCSHTLITRSP
jgi:Zn-dependent protease